MKAADHIETINILRDTALLTWNTEAFALEIQCNIDKLFSPNAVAIIGASENPGKIGHSICNNIIQGKFKGKVYPVNKKGGVICGLKAVKSVTEITPPPDLAVIAVPAPAVFEAVKECADTGIPFVQIISSGFAEAGNEELEKKIVSYANERGTRILGPNTFGIYASKANLNATFSATPIHRGSVALLSQSGALGVAMIGRTSLEKIGLSTVVSLGNMADIDESDCLSYLAKEEETKAVLMYLEGIHDGAKFLRALAETTRKKPVIILKAGRSRRGAMAAASHTGSLAGSDKIFEATASQFGAIRAENLRQGFEWVKYLALSPEPAGERVVIITNGGGVGVLAADACEKYDLHLYDEITSLEKIFGSCVPSFGSIKNPIDITGSAISSDYYSALTAPAESDKIDATVALYCETAVFDAENLVPMIRETYEKHLSMKKPVTYALIGGKTVNEAMQTLRHDSLPVYDDVLHAVSSLGVLYKYHRYKKRREKESDIIPITNVKLDSNVIERAIKETRKAERTFLSAQQAREVMLAADLPVPKSFTVTNSEECAKRAKEIGFPVVLKIVSPNILHKSDAGGVLLNIQNSSEAKAGFEKIMKSCKKYDPTAKLEGVEVAEMVKSGVEVIVGGKRDPQMGPVVMCGMGGIYVEIFKDVAFRSAWIDKKEIHRMLEELNIYKILCGVRGESKRDIETVVDTVSKIAAIIRTHDDIREIEINPLLVYEEGKGARAVDARILLTKRPTA